MLYSETCTLRTLANNSFSSKLSGLPEVFSNKTFFIKLHKISHKNTSGEAIL